MSETSAPPCPTCGYVPNSGTLLPESTLRARLDRIIDITSWEYDLIHNQLRLYQDIKELARLIQLPTVNK